MIHRLARQAEHEIEVDVVEPGIAQLPVRVDCGRDGMHAADHVEQLVVERLHAHGDAVHAKLAEESCLLRRDRRWVAFDRPFGRAGNSFQDAPHQRSRQQAGRSAAEKNRLGGKLRCEPFEFAQHGAHVTGHLVGAAGFGVERAIVALGRAERDMHVKMLNDGRGHNHNRTW